jgi:hypothetical protein
MFVVLSAIFLVVGCATDEGNHDAGQDAGSQDAQFKPYMPPAPKNPYMDEKYVQEFNHTSNEVEPGIGPLVGVVIPPDGYTGFDTPTQVTPRGVVRHREGGFDILKIDDSHPDLTGAAATKWGLLILTSAEYLYTVNKAGEISARKAPDGVTINGVFGGKTAAYLATSSGVAVIKSPDSITWGTGASVNTATEIYSSMLAEFNNWTTGVVSGGLDAVWVQIFDEKGSLGPAAKIGPDDGLNVGDVRALIGLEFESFMIIGDKGIQQYDALDRLFFEKDIYKAGSYPLGSPRAGIKTSDEGFIVVTSGGAYRLMDRGNGPEWRVYNAERWLPSADVRAVATDPSVVDGPVWFATAGGLATVTAKRMTLEEKFAITVDRVMKRHDRDGAVADSHLTRKGDLSSNIPWDSDNDGSWTAYWLMGECFRYKVTGDPVAKTNFDRALQGMLNLTELTGVDYFLARSVIRKEGCRLDDCDDPDDGAWYNSPDGKWWVKRDTSNDEVGAHFMMMGHAYDLCADDAQKAAIRRHMVRIAGGIMDHAWQLIDPITGEVTTYGQFDPDYVTVNVVGKFGDGGVRAAMALEGLTMAYYMTGEKRFMDGKDYLIKVHGYDKEAQTMWDHPFHQGNNDGNEMGTYAWFGLIRYEQDPKLRAKWADGWYREWVNVLKPQQAAWWIMAAAVMGSDDYDLEEAARWMKLTPVDMIRWQVTNSNRLDLVKAPAPYDKDGAIRSDGRIIPYDERRNDRWNTDQFRVDGGMGGMIEMDGADAYCPYWMGRWYGFIVPAKQ